jgi:hypothetical protein
MENLAILLKNQTKSHAQPSKSLPNKYSATLEIIRNPSDYCAHNGVSAYDLIKSGPVKDSSLAFAKEVLEQNFGAPIPNAKWMMLCQRIIEEDWTEARFKKTLNWFLDNKKFPSWTIADWFDYDVKLMPFAWVRQHCIKSGLREIDFIRSLDCYLVEGIRLYKMKDGISLPLERMS